MRLNWFRQWGWLYLPASVPGVMIFLGLLALCIQVFLTVHRHSPSASDTLCGVFPFFTCAFLLWDWIGVRTSNY